MKMIEETSSLTQVDILNSEENPIPKSEEALFAVLEVSPDGFKYGEKETLIKDVYSAELSQLDPDEVKGVSLKYSAYLHSLIDRVVYNRKFPDSMHKQEVKDRMNRIDNWLQVHPVYGQVYDKITPEYFERILTRLDQSNQRSSFPKLNFEGFCFLTGYQPPEHK